MQAYICSYTKICSYAMYVANSFVNALKQAMYKATHHYVAI